MRIISWDGDFTVPEEGTTVMIKKWETGYSDRVLAEIRLYRPELPKEGVVAKTYGSVELAVVALERFLKAVEDGWLFFQFPDNDDMKRALERKKKNGGE